MKKSKTGTAKAPLKIQHEHVELVTRLSKAPILLRGKFQEMDVVFACELVASDAHDSPKLKPRAVLLDSAVLELAGASISDPGELLE